jgi:hypothetical protein
MRGRKDFKDSKDSKAIKDRKASSAPLGRKVPQGLRVPRGLRELLVPKASKARPARFPFGKNLNLPPLRTSRSTPMRG